MYKNNNIMKWKEEEVNFLLKHYNKIGRAECAKVLNRSIDSVSSKIRDSKLKISSKEIWDEKSLIFLKENYEKYGVDYCVKHLGFNRRRIITKANLLGLITNVVIKTESKNKPKVNYRLFGEEFTKESVYILGLLWADGHVRLENKTTSISCKQSDIDEVIPVFLKTGDWLISKPLRKFFNNNEVKTQKKIHTTTWGLFDTLKEYGYSTKTNGCPNYMLNKIPNNLKKYWYRGFLDGDGCIRLGKNYGSSIVFSGTYNQDWSFMENLCCYLNIRYLIDRRIVKLGSYSYFIIYRKNDVKLLGDYLYSDYDNIGFSRKYKKYLEICKRFDDNKHKFWSVKETEWLKNNYYKLGGPNCAKILNKTLTSIYNKVKTLK